MTRLIKSFLSFVLILLFSCHVNAQTITGKVYKTGTDSAIIGASVYYNGSTNGTITDNNGRFELHAKAQNVPLVISCIGYNSKTIIYKPGDVLIVYLDPKTVELHSVTIAANGMSREDEMRLFIDEFIGTSPYANSCTIKNPDDIDLFYNKKTQTLTANCDKPIIIENKALGYIITYYLHSFTRAPDNIVFDGNYSFKEIQELSKKEKTLTNRNYVYQNSRMQFIRCLWNHTLDKTSFQIYDINQHRLTEDSIIARDSLQQQYIHIKGQVSIIFGRSTSFLTTNEKYSYINKEGFYGTGLRWGGQMAYQRIGDLLPFEYNPENEAVNNLSIVSGNDQPKTVKTEKPSAANSAPNNKLYFEKVYLHTDRDLYTQGDTIWYKAYLVNAQNNQPINISGNLYVELIQPDSAKLISRQIIRMDYGTGSGDIQLSDSIPSGKYTLRAYTNWMRNFGDNFIFEKGINILNTTPPKFADMKPGSIASKKPIQLNANFKATINTPVIRFFPESGSLVEGVGSIIAVKAENRLGNGIAASGVVLSISGDTIAHFNCDSIGMGLFAMLPVAGQKYHARLTSNVKKVFDVDVPQALLKGFSLRVSHTDSVVSIIIGCNDAQLIEAKGKTFTLSGKHGGKVCFMKSFQVSENQILIKVSTELFPDGVAAITLTDDTNKPQCERLIYIRHKTNNLTISTDKTSYQSKEKVTVKINTGEMTNVSMAVVDAGLVPVQQQDITSYLQLQSELKGNIEHPERYFDTTNTHRDKQLDMLLMTQGWRDFVWRRLADTAIRISYKAEDGFDVTGRVRQKFGDKPIKNMNITLSAFKARGQKLFSARTDSAGKYAINNLQLYGPQSLKLTARDDKGTRAGWLLMDSVNKEPLPVQAEPNIVVAGSDTTAIVKAITKRLEESSKSNMKNGIKLKEVKITDRKTIVLQTGIPASTFGYPDQVFNITKKDEFYQSLENWLAHNINGAIINDQPGIMFYAKGRGGIKAAEGASIISLEGLVYPVMIVNGREIVPQLGRYILLDRVSTVAQELTDDDIIMEQTIMKPYFDLGMDKIKSVVLRHMVGIDPYYAKTIDVYVLYLNVVPGALENKDFGAEITNIDGYYQARTFYKPQHDASKSTGKPDLRTTIHWEPNIVTDAKGQATVSFYNADPKTNIRVIVEGIKAAGGPVTGSMIYKVK